MRTIQAELHAVTVPDNRRRKSGPVSAIAESMERVGLINPITLTEDLVLISGLHRFEAAQSLGWERIDARIIDADARLVEIDENLCRNELTALERAEHRSERKRLHEAVYPEAKHGRNQHTRASVDTSRIGNDFRSSTRQEPGSYSSVAAAKEGVTDRTVRLSVAIAENIPEDVRDEIRDLPIADNQKELSRLSKLAEPEQREVARMLVAGEVDDLRAATGAMSRRERVSRIAQIEEGNRPLPEALGRFPVVLADPPWRYEHSKTSNREIENHYPTMSLDEIKALEVSGLATDDAVLFLWTTSPKLAESLEVLASWGFVYRTCWVWVKDRIGMGYYARQRHELVLIATRGSIPVPIPSARPDSVLEAPRGKHSAKPAEAYERIEAMYPEYRKVELFSRTPREGWAAWGNQCEQ